MSHLYQCHACHVGHSVTPVSIGIHLVTYPPHKRLSQPWQSVWVVKMEPWLTLRFNSVSRSKSLYYTTQLTFCFCWSTACFITISSFCGNATKWLMIVSAANMGYNKLNIATTNVPSYMFQASDPFCCKCLLTICQSVWLIYSDQSVCYVPIIALCHRMLEFSFCNISLGTLIQNISLIL